LISQEPEAGIKIELKVQKIEKVVEGVALAS